MNVDINKKNILLLSEGFNDENLFSKLKVLNNQKLKFNFEFGLEELPVQAGIIKIRGARQFGKSTWMELKMFQCFKKFGHGSTLYLNGDDIKDDDRLYLEIQKLLLLYRKNIFLKYLFIDEITSVKNWEKSIKRLADDGSLSDVLLITTGSSATDLRRGKERLPGRKGKLNRSDFIFCPISYSEFHRLCFPFLKDKTLFAYLLSGGSPIAANELVDFNHEIPAYLETIIRDWILGEFSKTGRSRNHLLSVVETLFRLSPNPIGYTKLARESELANNTLAHNYCELLQDILTIEPLYFWDPSKRRSVFRKPCKLHFINTLVAGIFHPLKPRKIEDVEDLTPITKGVFWEWLVAQELFRRKCIQGKENFLNYWKNENHEIDFIVDGKIFIEVKFGQTNLTEFVWFPKIFPKNYLTVISLNRYQSNWIQGVTMQDFLLDQTWKNG